MFTSLGFITLFPFFFLLYYFVKEAKVVNQNSLLLLSGLLIYSLFDIRFLPLIIVTGFITYYFSNYIERCNNQKKKRTIFYATIFIIILPLLFFKYVFPFLREFLQLPNSYFTTDDSLLLPIGISFYTFQLIALIIDVYNEEIESPNHLGLFFTYLFYFPKLFLGPIESYKKFTDQILRPRNFNYQNSIDGMKQFLWGLFKKMAVANNCSFLADTILNNYTSHSDLALIVGSMVYIIYVYADFSGYSDMACGLSRLLGIKIINNFNFPFFSTSISEYWRKWHISLTQWMLKYVYTPLSFYWRRIGKMGLVLSIISTFLLVGLWHGPVINYLIFGLIHGILFIPIIYSGKAVSPFSQSNNIKQNPILIGFKMFLLFIIVSFASIFFRYESTQDSFSYFTQIFDTHLVFNLKASLIKIMLPSMLLISILFLIEFIGRKEEFALKKILISQHFLIRWSLYSFIIFLIGIFMFNGENSFVYLKF